MPWNSIWIIYSFSLSLYMQGTTVLILVTFRQWGHKILRGPTQWVWPWPLTWLSTGKFVTDKQRGHKKPVNTRNKEQQFDLGFWPHKLVINNSSIFQGQPLYQVHCLEYFSMERSKIIKLTTVALPTKYNMRENTLNKYLLSS